MRTFASYRFVSGLGLLSVIFFADLNFPWGVVLYLAFIVFLVSLPVPAKQNIILGLVATLLTISGYFFGNTEPEFDFYQLSNRFLLVAMVWLVVFFHVRARYPRHLTEEYPNKLAPLNTLNETDAKQRLTKAEQDLDAARIEKELVQEELLKEKRLLDTLVKHYPDGVIGVLNRDMKYVFAEGQGLEDFGLTAADLKGNDAIIGSGAELKGAFNGESISFETNINHDSYAVNAIPIPDAKGEIHEILIIIRNITDWRSTWLKEK